MPRVSFFLGIAIYIYGDDARRHHRPHIHAVYGGKKAAYAIDTGQVLAGKLPRQQSRRVREWIEQRREELLENWERAQRLEPPTWIDPL